MNPTLTRANWLHRLDLESEEHLGTLRIYGRDVDMTNPVELKLVLIWLAWTSTVKLQAMQEALDDC